MGLFEKLNQSTNDYGRGAIFSGTVLIAVIILLFGPTISSWLVVLGILLIGFVTLWNVTQDSVLVKSAKRAWKKLRKQL